MHPGILIGLGALALAVALIPRGGGLTVPAYHRGLVVGDSHSEAAWTFGGRLGIKLQEAGMSATVAGNRGKTVKWYVDTGELERQLAAAQPELLVVALGANDMARNESNYKDYLQRFVGLAKAAGVRKIIWFGPSKSEREKAHLMPNRDKIAKWQSEMLPTLNVEWHDSMPLTYDLPTRDGVHYRSAEYGVWSDRAAQLIFDDVRVA